MDDDVIKRCATTSATRFFILAIVASVAPPRAMGQYLPSLAWGPSANAIQPSSFALSPVIPLTSTNFRHLTIAPNQAGSTATLFPRSPDHRWEGLAIGALTFAAAGIYAGSRFCQLSDSVNKHCFRTSLKLGLLGAFTGGIIGGLIGGTIPKPPSDSIP